MTARALQILVVTPHALSGDNRGIRELHVDALEALFADSSAWIVSSTDGYDPSFPDAALACDVLVLHMAQEPELDALIQLRRERGRPTVYEIQDNIVGVDEWLPPDARLRSPLARQRLLHLASLCDALHVFSPQQAVLFSHVNPVTAVARYYIPVPETLPAKPPGFVLGWGGSRSHRGDLAPIAPVVTEFCRRHADVRFEYVGDETMFGELFSDIPPDQVRTWPYSPREEYLGIMRGWHVGLGPLRRSPFNVARSDERFVNYAVSGVAAVLSDEPTFWPHRERASLFKTPTELAAILESLHADRALVADLAARAHRWVLVERNRDVLRNERAGQYRALLPPTTPPTAVHKRFAPDRSSSAQLYSAAVAAAAKEFERSLTVCRELLAQQPDYQQAAILAVRVLDASGRAEEALAFGDGFEWHPIYRDVANELLHQIALRSRRAEAKRYLERVVSPLRRMRREPLSGNRLEQFRRTLAHQPFDYFALFGAIKMLERTDPHSTELAELYERACLLRPEEVPEGRRPDRLKIFLPS